MTLLIDAAWLEAHRDEVVVADVRWSPAGGTAAATEAFETGHIPGAVFFDIDRDLAGEPFVDGPGRHPLPRPESFASALGARGIGAATYVVAYDDVRDSLAARLWWMLDALGQQVSLLDGGLAAWAGELEVGPARRDDPVDIDPRPWPVERIVDASAVSDALRGDSAVVLDARAAERFRGEVEPIDPVAGHIPGAVSVPWSANLGADGRFLPAEELRARFAPLLKDRPAVAHCGSGVTACHALVALRLAGIDDGRLYVGSWSDWVHDPARPVATGEADGQD
jgi:thiosulfate/3-mercaptopyruvate sulfurtransferase